MTHRGPRSADEILNGDFDHHALIGSDEALSSFLKMERLLADIPPEGLKEPLNGFDAASAQRAPSQSAQRAPATSAPPAHSAPPPAAATTKVLTLQALEDIRAEHMADDLEIDEAVMSSWTEDMAHAFFENGGVLPASITF